MYKEFGVNLTADLKWHLQRFYNEQRNVICRILNQRGYTGYGDRSQVTPANKLTFACEAAETTIMAGALRYLLNCVNVESLVWLHDGMYVHESVSTNLIREAFRDAAQRAQVPQATVKITHCSEIALKHKGNGVMQNPNLL
jgi:hypothetical protein